MQRIGKTQKRLLQEEVARLKTVVVINDDIIKAARLMGKHELASELALITLQIRTCYCMLSNIAEHHPDRVIFPDLRPDDFIMPAPITRKPIAYEGSGDGSDI